MSAAPTATLRNDPTWNPPRVIITIGVFTLAQAEPGPPMKTAYTIHDDSARHLGALTLHRDRIEFHPKSDDGPILSQAQVDAVADALVRETRRRRAEAAAE